MSPIVVQRAWTTWNRHWFCRIQSCYRWVETQNPVFKALYPSSRSCFYWGLWYLRRQGYCDEFAFCWLLMNTVKGQACWGSKTNNTLTKQKLWSFIENWRPQMPTSTIQAKKIFHVEFASMLSVLASHPCEIIAYTELVVTPVLQHLFQPGRHRPAKPLPWNDSP